MGGLAKGLSLVGLCVTALIIMKLVASNLQSSVAPVVPTQATEGVQNPENATPQQQTAVQKAEDARTMLENSGVPTQNLPDQ